MDERSEDRGRRARGDDGERGRDAEYAQYDEYHYDEYDEYEPRSDAGADGPDAEDGAAEAAPKGRSGRGKARRSKAAGKPGKERGGKRAAAPDAPAAGARRGRRASTTSSGPIEQVSKFSASALKRVTVLGDRPSQMVYSLAEQSQRKRGTYVLGGLLGLFGVALVALLGVLGYQLVVAPADEAGGAATQIVAPPEGHSTLQPELFHAQPQQEIFAPIAERPEGAEPLTVEQVFNSAEKLKLSSFELTLRDSEVTDTCTAVVWGDDLAQALADGSCTSAARGVYRDENDVYVAQFTLFDLADAEAAAAVSEELDPQAMPGFVLPMDDEIPGLHEGYSQATSQVMGHYLAVFWVARADGADPKDDESMATLNVVAMDAAVSVYEQVSAATEGEG
ncbi:hypothetical protein DEF23_12825 [Marinitenerispora sediminis]|uniref:Uncharacterized protein n=1 Tax=Marinitenerispora sediminis TaxID=1931232 RepID=A0A368SYI6_9ACTN|nr:hypothetical protein DEF24_25330 [Marinitenerispora sediminis]RCV50737.1 hypothetical protein DEF28_17320 [Marinitenerispora sediminis]RCV56335.1 hypothetical protein DEF23_12825 [Marinitenerispora sediminis]